MTDELAAQVATLGAETAAASAAADEAARQLLYELRNGMGDAYLATARDRATVRHNTVERMTDEAVAAVRAEVDQLAAAAPALVDRHFAGFTFPHARGEYAGFSATLPKTLGEQMRALWAELGRILINGGIDDPHDRAGWIPTSGQPVPGPLLTPAAPVGLQPAWEKYLDAWEAWGEVHRELARQRVALSQARAADKWGS
jgi:hypothetical protein